MKLDPKIEAQKVLNSLWEEDCFPVDPITIARRLGVRVMDMQMPPGVSGALVKEPEKDPYIILDKDDHNNRKRFSCAHELGHYISRIESNNIDIEYSYVDLRSDLSSCGIDEEEIFANRFAANLLMPGILVKKFHKKGNSHFEMAIFFGVSTEALKYRLKALGLLKNE